MFQWLNCLLKKWQFSAIYSLILLTLLLMTSAAVQAQTFRGRVIGTVKDSQGLVVAGATITVTDTGKNLSRTATSDQDGNFTIFELPAGTYSVAAEAQGFSRTVFSNVEVSVGRDSRCDFSLSASGSSEVITVEGGSTLINTNSTENGGVLDNKQLLELPLNGRDFQDLIGLRPGFQRQPGGGFGSINVNGQRNTSNNFQVDGISNNDNYFGTVAQGQEGVNVKSGGFLPIDAIQEFTTTSNPKAEFGSKAGGVINVALKSGSNEFHGTVYEFLRNEKLDARAFFNTDNQPKNPLRQNQFGFTLGGPVVKDKLFFFGNYEGQRVRQSESFIVNTPGQAAIAAATPASGINPLSARILQLFPLGDSQNRAPVTIPTFSDIDNYLIKMDYVIDARNTISGRYVIGNTDQTELDNFFLRPEYVSASDQRSQLLGASYTSLLTNNLTNEVRFGYTRLRQFIAPLDRDANPADIGFVTGVTDPSRFGFPVIRITGFDNLGGRNTNLFSDPNETYTIVDNVSWKKGKHDIKLGGDFRFDRSINTRDIAARGEFRFRSLADFLSGRIDRASVLTGSTKREISQKSFSLFMQDDFKLTPRITLNYGLRYEFFGVISEANDLLANFIPGRGLVQVGSPDLNRPYERDNNNFAPRVGIAWNLFGNNKTVIRASWGLFYDPPALSAFVGQNGNVNAITPTLGLNFNPVGSVNSYVIRPRGSALRFNLNQQIFPNFNIPTSFLDVLAIDRNIRTPYSQNYSFNIQQEVWKNGVLEVGYVGSRGTKLYSVTNINQVSNVDTGERPFDTQLVNRDGDPVFQYVNLLAANTNSSYNSLQLTFNQRNVRGFSALVGYTFAKSLDTVSSNRPVNPQNSLNLGAERARSDFNVEHRFTASFSYDIPRLKFLPQYLGDGFAVNSLMTFQTGRPVDVFYSDDFSGFLEFNDRPNIIGDINQIKFQPNEAIDPRLLNTVFARPALGTFGNAGRNLLTAPGFTIVDFSVTKNTKLTERFRLQFRAEFFNIANNPEFARPSGSLLSANFGSLRDTADRGNPLASGGPRRIQFGLKLYF
ncbi:MAG: TonB-dependent receptor [Blastocatellia bacterium]|nr:TonB-dependent receptor [Blastocatellia bacterium]